MAPSFNFYRIFEILDRLDGKRRFGVRFGPGIWGLYHKQPVHPFCPPPLLHHAQHKHQWPLHGGMPSCRSQGMPLDGRSGLNCMRISIRAVLPHFMCSPRCCLQVLARAYVGRPMPRPDVGGALRHGEGPVRLLKPKLGGAG